MKKFILRVTIVVVLILFIFYFFQYLIDNRAKNVMDIFPYRTLNMVRKPHMIDADVVIFGNSRAQNHYNTAVMDSILRRNCFNLGLAGRSFDYIYNLVILPYFDNNKLPKLVIVEVCPQAFFAHWNPNYVTQYLPYIGEKYSRFYVNLCDEISPVDRYLPTKYFGLKQALTELSLDNTKHVAKHKDSAGFCRVGTYKVNFPDTIYSIERDAQILQYFQQFVSICQDKDVKLLFVCSPMHQKDFYEHCEMEKFWLLIDSIAPNVPTMDYSLMFGSDTIYFFESTHLNKYGADIFSRQVSLDIDSLGILRK
ncbi:MAG: hypothetical protein SOT07_08900 [Paludibacteraceae bacterium]|nr:hypothetical protein [Paludibacteraceae bacterium]